MNSSSPDRSSMSDGNPNPVEDIKPEPQLEVCGTHKAKKTHRQGEVDDTKNHALSSCVLLPAYLISHILKSSSRMALL
jgi:hypothetical protein